MRIRLYPGKKPYRDLLDLQAVDRHQDDDQDQHDEHVDQDQNIIQVD
jgi:hypothetical protein